MTMVYTNNIQGSEKSQYSGIKLWKGSTEKKE